MIDILLYAALAGMLVAAVAGPLGSLVVWQRMAYFGDTLAHSALLGTALGLLLEIEPWLTVLAGSLLIGGLLAALQEHPHLNIDSLLGIISHSALALGLLALGLFDPGRVDLGSYLFGDLLAVTPADLTLIAAAAAAIFAMLWRYWDRLLAVTVHAELAAVEGLPVLRLRLIQMVGVALLVAAAMKVVGVLLVTALLIIPVNAARPWSRTPEQMAGYGALVGIMAVACGLGLSFWLDTPTGPSIVATAALCFALSFGARIAAGRLRGRRRRALG